MHRSDFNSNRLDSIGQTKRNMAKDLLHEPDCEPSINFIRMDMICFSHLRWNFVYQRPQHLLSRFSPKFRVFVIEEPVFDAEAPYLDKLLSKEKVWVITPHLPQGLNDDENILQQQILLKKMFAEFEIEDYVSWFYTPMALDISEALPPAKLVIYDCMDELSAFKNAPAKLYHNEEFCSKKQILFLPVDIVYTKQKKNCITNIFPFPSSIDKEHFCKSPSNKLYLLIMTFHIHVSAFLE